VRQRLGARSGLREAEIRETLWYYYFDVDESVAWLAGCSLLIFLLTSTEKYKKAEAGKPHKATGPKKPVNSEGRLPLTSSFVFLAMNVKLWKEI
jgi:HBS1 N-terminus